MLEALLRFIDRTRLDPDLVVRDDAVLAGEGPQLAAALIDAAAQAEGGVAWGRISCRYLAGQRVLSVLDGSAWWDANHSWPPPHDGADLPDEIATLAELVTLLAGEGIELADPAPFSPAAWVAALPDMARLSSGGLVADPDELAGPCNQNEGRLTRASALNETWLAQGPTTDPADELWRTLEERGGLDGLLNNVDVLLERPAFLPQFRGAARILLNAGAVGGVPELQVAHALRVVCHGSAAFGAALADPSLNHVPFLDALDRLGRFLDVVCDSPSPG